MKKVLTFLLALALSSASQSDPSLSNQKLRPQPPPLKLQGHPRISFADNEQYLSQNSHSSLQSLTKNRPAKLLKPIPFSSGQNRLNTRSVDNSLDQLKQMMKQGVRAKNKEKVQKPKRQPAHLYIQPIAKPSCFHPPRRVKRERQPY